MSGGKRITTLKETLSSTILSDKQTGSYQKKLVLFHAFPDSLLGATIQFSGLCEKTGKIVETPGSDVKPISGFPLCSNHSINLISSAITAFAVPLGVHLMRGAS